MQPQIRQPVITPRVVNSRPASHLFDKNMPDSFVESVNALLPRKQSFIPKNPPALTHQTSFKNTCQLYKIDPNIVPQLLEKYTQANLFYRDEEFSQQADMFLTKMAIDRRIPDEFRVRFPFYQILVCLSKIFMLNEFELGVFACTLDRCNWNLDEVLTLEEGNCLREFPSNFGLEIGNECKRFIIYLLVITFALKQYLGEKTEVDQIQCYCEHICNNFQTIYNKWLRVAPANRFSFSLQEINRKYRHLAKRDIDGFQSSVKDYNMMVDEIMGLTGSYTARTKETRPLAAGHAQAYEEPAKAYIPKPQIFHDFNFQAPADTRMSQGISVPFMEDRRGNVEQHHQQHHQHQHQHQHQQHHQHQHQQASVNDVAPIRMPSFLANLSRQPSYNNLISNLQLNKNQPSFIDNMDDTTRKHLKKDDHGIPMLQNQLSLARVGSHYKPADLQHSFSSLFKNDEMPTVNMNMGVNLPLLSKNYSQISQDGEEMPGLARFQSNLSFLYDQ